MGKQSNTSQGAGTEARAQKVDVKKLAGAIGGVVLGLVAYFALTAAGDIGLTSQGVICLAVLLWAIVWWIVGVLPEFATAILMVIAFAVFAGVGIKTSCSAFATETWWLLIAAFSLGAGMKTSGLMRRMALAIIRKFPNTFQAQVGGLMAVGTILGPLVPSLSAKTAMLTPIAMSMGDAMGYKRQGREMQGLFLAMLVGVRNIGPAVISASVIGYALWGLMPADVQAQFDMLHWFLTALPWFIVVTILNYVAIVALYRPRKGAKGAGAATDEAARTAAGEAAAAADAEADAAMPASEAVAPAAETAIAAGAEAATASGAAVSTTPGAAAPVADSIAAASAAPAAASASAAEELGPMSLHEKEMLAIILVTVVLWVTEPLHGVSSTVVALAALVVMVACGIMSAKTLKTDVAWSSLIFIGIVVGLSNVFSAVGIQDWIITVAGPVFTQLASNSYTFVLGIGVITILLRFIIVSEMAYINIVMVFLIPLAVAQGINPWIVGIAVYAVVNPWFALYQNPVYLAAYYSVDGAMVRHGDMAKYCVLYMLICLAGLAVGVPFWQAMGLFG